MLTPIIMQQERKLPIGIQTFEDIRRNGYLYVDKTDLVWRMVSMGKPYFLSRPRRFGKSLLLSTLEAYFQGKKELFEGLAIEKLEAKWEAFPVLHLDLNARRYATGEDLVGILNQHLESWEALYGDVKRDRAPEERFAYVIEQAYRQSGHPVVVLVDEYDKPLLQALQDKELMESYRTTLKAFYGVLKSCDRYLRFVFLTGVAKFAQVSVFSDLNQLNDISLDWDFATLCGMTHRELVENFMPELERMAEVNDMTVDEVTATMTRQYDGYHFHPKGEGVFNPFSLLSSLSKKEFGSYWFQTGTPSFLVQLLKESDYDLRTLMEGVEADVTSFSEYRAERSNPIPLIYQSGYLTIKDFDRQFRQYRLEFPNEEVRYGFLNFLIPFYTAVGDSERNFHVVKFIRELRSGDVDAFMRRFEAFFADFPYELNDRTERHYQVVIYLVFKLMGQFIQAEVHSARGRADAVVQTPDRVYIFEFKLDGSAEEALLQIEEMGYARPFAADRREVVRVGVEFSTERRNVKRWLVE